MPVPAETASTLTPKQAERRARIEQAAYEVLREAGYNSASLLAIAKRASVSNETLYKWYGNKQGLFRTLVESNAREARQMLEAALAAGEGDLLETLAAFGPVLLALVTGDRAISLNRAAAGDVSDTGTLGRSIAEAGRETIRPLLCELLTRACEAGLVSCADPAQAADTYFHLLIGDLQIRRVIGAVGELEEEEIERRSQRAHQTFLMLYSPDQGGVGK